VRGGGARTVLAEAAVRGRGAGGVAKQRAAMAQRGAPRRPWPAPGTHHVGPARRQIGLRQQHARPGSRDRRCRGQYARGTGGQHPHPCRARVLHTPRRPPARPARSSAGRVRRTTARTGHSAPEPTRAPARRRSAPTSSTHASAPATPPTRLRPSPTARTRTRDRLSPTPPQPLGHPCGPLRKRTGGRCGP